MVLDHVFNDDIYVGLFIFDLLHGTDDQAEFRKSWPSGYTFVALLYSFPCLLSAYSGYDCTVLKKLTRFLDSFDQTFLGLGLGKLFPARESLVSDIPAGDGKSLGLYLQCVSFLICGPISNIYSSYESKRRIEGRGAKTPVKVLEMGNNSDFWPLRSLSKSFYRAYR